MYEVTEKQKELKNYLRKLRNQVRKDEIDGICVIAFKKDKLIERYQFDGHVSVVEWVGALEAVKTYFLASLLDDIDEYY